MKVHRARHSDAALVGEILGDERKFKQILLNLLSNAVKFTPGGGRVSVRLESDERTARIIVEDNGRRTLKRVLEAIRDSGGTLIYVLGMSTSPAGEREDEIRAGFPDVSYLSMAELFGGPFLTQVGRSLTRARVQQYQRYFSDADRILILLHNDPDPDAMASGLALRTLSLLWKSFLLTSKGVFLQANP